jgi:hypothetical protein
MTASTESPRAPLAARRRFPDFFIVGHHKSGTTALYEMLRSHPQIYMPALKEPRYFASDLRVHFEAMQTGRVPTTLEDYLALFKEARPDQLMGEASPSYLRSRVAARAIAEVQPRARIIAILREPASFVRSLHFQLMQDRVETEPDLRRALAAEQIERGGERVRRYSDHLHYAEQLRRYHDAFPREQVLVLIYDDFRADNAATVREVLRFLGVDDRVELASVEANPTVRLRSARLDWRVSQMYGARGPLGRAIRRVFTALTPDRLRRAALGRLRRGIVYGKPEPPDAGLMRELRHRFKPEVVALSEYLGQDLISRWGYHDVD